MGNFCCANESPCGSAEERSSLLKDESKMAAPTGEPVVGGTCGPDAGDDMRKTHDEAGKKVEEKAEAVQIKQSPEKGESQANNTQENGPVKKENTQKTMTSPRKGFVTEENSTRAQDEGVKEPAGDGGQTQLQKCTFTPQQKSNGAASWEDFTKTNVAPKEETPCFAADKISTGTSLTTEMSSPTEKTAELMAASVSHGDKEEEEKTSSRVTANNAVNEPSGEFSQNNEALSVPDAAACQVSSISAVSEEINKQSPSCVGTEDPVSAQDSPEGLKNHDESVGPEPAGLNHSGEERGTANSVGVTETTALADASESSKSDQSVKPDPESSAPNPKEVALLENIEQKTEEDVKEQDKDGDVPKVKKKDEEEEEEEGEEAEEEEEAPSVSDAQDEKDVEVQEETGGEEQQQQQQQLLLSSGSEAAEVEVKDTAATEKKDDAAEDDLGNSEEDLYRGAEELSGSQSNDTEPSSLSETSLLKVEDRCSLSPAVDILSYSEREWKGNTAKSALIRKGYKDMSQRFGSVRRVRGDNYCALRATLFQVLSHSPRLPAWLREEDAAVATLLKQLEDEDGLISQWTFPGSCLQGDGTRDVSQQLKSYMELLRNKWQEAVECPSAIERQLLCERTFRGSEEELGLLEALKLLMLIRAVELHGRMKAGDDVPLFCWLLFARDSSDCPRSFLSNHLSHVGLSAGLEQVEMFLLGYALQCTIQVYRLYKADTEEFVTFYPDDHKDEWPSVCLVTEDDRHYNVPVGDAAEPREEPSSS